MLFNDNDRNNFLDLKIHILNVAIEYFLTGKEENIDYVQNCLFKDSFEGTEPRADLFPL